MNLSVALARALSALMSHLMRSRLGARRVFVLIPGVAGDAVVVPVGGVAGDVLQVLAQNPVGVPLDDVFVGILNDLLFEAESAIPGADGTEVPFEAFGDVFRFSQALGAPEGDGFGPDAVVAADAVGDTAGEDAGDAVAGGHGVSL